MFSFPLAQSKIYVFLRCHPERKRGDEESAFFALFRKGESGQFAIRIGIREDESFRWFVIVYHLRYIPVEQLSNLFCSYGSPDDNSLSTSERSVYQCASTINIEQTYQRDYCAIAKDLSSLIIFSTTDGKVGDSKKYCIRISKEDLLPQKVNPSELDFLNE